MHHELTRIASRPGRIHAFFCDRLGDDWWRNLCYCYLMYDNISTLKLPTPRQIEKTNPRTVSEVLARALDSCATGQL